MTIEFSIKGVTLNAAELSLINEYYEAACTAEYVLENYSPITDEAQAMEIGHEVRRKMNKYGYDEEEAIRETLEEIEDE